MRRVAGRVRRRLRGRAEAAQSRELMQHIAHLERRLHIAEHKVKQLTATGLTTDAPLDVETFARWLSWRPPGHFYSPIPNLRELEAQADVLWPEKLPTELPGIDLRPEEQLQTFSHVAKLARALEIHEHKTDPWRYYSDNVAYAAGDGLTLHGMLRIIRPERLIEIGSGHSSAMTLDTVEHFLGGKTQLTFIEPYPELLESLMNRGDYERVTVIPTPLQQVPLDTFATLHSGDVLFIDSTHVLKTGSDVARLYGWILPSLAEGVHVHIHDMFYPFEYPREWVMEGRAWSEVYIVRALLALTSGFEITLFNDWLAQFHHEVIERELPRMLANTGGALWLRRVRPPG
jgi:hypothetical protein